MGPPADVNSFLHGGVGVRGMGKRQIPANAAELGADWGSGAGFRVCPAGLRYVR